MKLKFVPDLFIGTNELTRFKQSLDDNGFRKALLSNSEKFGLVKLFVDSNFTNGKVSRDIDNSLGQKTIKINPINAIDSNGDFLSSTLINNLVVPADSNWYWIKVSHILSTQEVGKVAIDASGNLTGTGTAFTQVLRGQPDFPTTIKFIGSANNTLEYEVLEVTNDTHAVLVYPGVNDGTSSFVSESNLGYEVVGSFTEGVAIPNDNKKPFQYDSVQVSLVLETTPNTRPTHSQGIEFYLARVSVQSGILIVQDKRIDIYQTKGSFRTQIFNYYANPLIGVEYVKYMNTLTAGDKNFIGVAWGMRSSSWSIDSTQNIVTLFGGSLGGSYKITDNFVNGDFNGYRLYSSKANAYRTIVNSTKQGSSINLQLDVLDIDDYSNDGGQTFIGDLLVTPDYDSIQIRLLPEPTDNINDVQEIYTFPINTPVAECLATVYKTSGAKYNVSYRYQLGSNYTPWTPVRSGSYYTEDSFDVNGVMKGTSDRVVVNYTNDPTSGFIQLQMSPSSLLNFQNKVYKGDVIGVKNTASLGVAQVIELIVGTDKRYQEISGDLSLSEDVYISLSRAGAVEGNEFKIHFTGSLSLGTYSIYIVDDYSSGVLRTIKKITQADAYQLQNQDNGLLYTCIFDGTKWIAAQNYSLGQPFELKMIDVSLADLPTYFDLTTKQGIAKGYYGWELHSVLNQGRVPIGYGTLTETIAGQSVTTSFAPQATGGESLHQLIIDELAKHAHFEFSDAGGAQDPVDATHYPVRDHGYNGTPTYRISGDTKEANVGLSSNVGGDKAHNNMQPYYVTIYVRKKY